MRDRLKTYVEVVLVTAILTFMAAMGVGVFVDVFWSSDSRAPEAFRGGFIGAFFAFLFVRLGDALRRLDERRRKTRDALLVLEHRYNQCAVALSTNKYLLGGWDKVAAAAANHEEVPNLSRFHPVEISVPHEPLLELTNLDLINELFNLNLDLDALARDLRNFSVGTGKIMDAFIDGKINRVTLDDNLLRANRDRLAFEFHVDRLMARLEQANAAIVVLLHGKKTLLEKFFIATAETRYSHDFEKARDEQIVKNRTQLEPAFKRRRDEIDEIEKRANAKAEEMARAARREGP